MVGLSIIKDKEGLSNEQLCERWARDPYFQYFCGQDYFEHDCRVKPQTISNFYLRIGEAGKERILSETVRVALLTGALDKVDLKKVTVDTTVQEKAVKFPTDTQLCHKAREELVSLASKHGIKLRQSYVRKGKEACFKANKYMWAKQTKRGSKEIKKLKNYLGRVMRDIERAVEKDKLLAGAFSNDLDKAQRQKPRISFIAGMPRKWSVSPKAKHTNATNLDAKPVMSVRTKVILLSVPWLCMGSLMTVICCKECLDRSKA